MSEQEKWVDQYIEGCFFCPYCNKKYEETELTWKRIAYDGQYGDHDRNLKCSKCDNHFFLNISLQLNYLTLPLSKNPIKEKPKLTLIKGGKE